MKRLLLICLIICPASAGAQNTDAIVLPRWDISLLTGEEQAVPEKEHEPVRNTKKEKRKLLPGYKKTRLAFDAAWIYRDVWVSEQLPHNFETRMKNGVSYSADFHYFHGHMVGSGVKASYNRFRYSKDGYGDRVNSVYIGPSFMLRTPFPDNTMFYAGFSFGYVYMNEKYRFLRERASQNLHGVKGSIDLGYDFLLSGGTYMGLRIGIVMDNVTDWKYTYTTTYIYDPEFDYGYYEETSNGFGQIEIGLGLRF